MSRTFLLKMSKYMLDKTSLMYLSHEIGSSKHVQVPKGFLAICVERGEGEMKLYLSKVDESDVTEIVNVSWLLQDGVTDPRMKTLDVGRVPLTDEHMLDTRRTDNAARSRVHAKPNRFQIRFEY